MFIGLTGSLAAGKGVVSEFFKSKGFVYLSLSDELREIAKEKKIELTRSNLQDLGNLMRMEKGAGFLAERVKNKIINQQYKKAIIDGIRNPAELVVLKELKNFFLVVVDAPAALRYKRLLERNRESDPKSWEDFLVVDKRDQGEQDERGQQTRKCMEQGDFVINNDGNLEDINKKVEETFNKIKEKIKKLNFVKKRDNYISWDEYFMGIALLSAYRSKDPNTQVGACIVNEDKNIIGIGYNGFPRGCSDDNLPWAREGDFLDTKYPYVCHAELNAILNSKGNLNESSIYVALFPCNECAKAIIQSGIKEVIYLSDKYAETDIVKASKIMLSQSGIRLRKMQFNKEICIKAD